MPPKSLRAYPLYEERRSCIFNGHPKGTPLSYPRSNPDSDFIVGSCDGILCFAAVAGGEDRPFLVWNPSIRKFKELEPLETKHPHQNPVPIYGFGYDHSCDDYKVIAGFCYKLPGDVFKCQINVNDLRTNVWRRKNVQDFPGLPMPNDEIGRLVSGTVNFWLVKFTSSFVIVSFDLGEESCQEISQPNYGVDSSVFVDHPDMFCLKLEVLRDCLSIIVHVRDFEDNEDYEYFWVMKEYGNRESWTKLFKVPHMKLSIRPWYGSFARIVCILKDSKGDDTLFMRWGSTLAVHSSTLTVFNCNHDGVCVFERFKPFIFPGIYVESFIFKM